MNRTFLGLCLIIVCAVIEGLAQISWKTASVQPQRSRLWITVGVVAYGSEIALYTLALTVVDVSVAFAMGSLSFVSVAVLSRLLLGEKISWMRGAGLLLILSGVAFMGGEA
jgi:undecaprenyl phosphate-alpha-L-ara4N flippase subunit ArnE